MKNLTKQILDKNDKFKISKKIVVPAIIASFFSVVFSLSIVFELKNIVNSTVLILLSIFVILFLILNETIKIREIKNMYKTKKFNYTFFVTFLISVTLSSIGIYFWTNKSFEQKNTSALNKTEQINKIETEFLNKISDVQSMNFESTQTFKTLNNDLNYWKNKSAATLDERNQIRDHIRAIENKIQTNRNEYNKSKNIRLESLISLKETKLNNIKTKFDLSLNNINHNNDISIIFFIMILITEIAIVILNIDVAKLDIEQNKFFDSKQVVSYLIARKVLISLFLTKSKDNGVTILHPQCSPVMNKLDWTDEKKWKETKKLYNLFINLSILDDGIIKETHGRKILHNRIITSKENALKKFDNYYNVLLSL